MKEQGSLINVVEQLRRSLFDVNMQFASHVKEVHQGIPASTCHPCLGFIAGVKNIEFYIEKNEVRILAIQDHSTQLDAQIDQT